MASSTRKRKRRLGKGLESLLAKPVEIEPPVTAPNDQVDSPDTTNNDDASESSVDCRHSEVGGTRNQEGISLDPRCSVLPDPEDAHPANANNNTVNEIGNIFVILNPYS